MRRALAAAVLVVAATTTVADDPQPAGKDWSSGDKAFTISLPAAWKLERAALGGAEISLDGDLPGGGGRVMISLERVGTALALNFRGFASRDRSDIRKQFDSDFKILDGPRAMDGPPPEEWIEVVNPDGAALRWWSGFRIVRHNELKLVVVAEAATWPKIRGDCVQALATLRATVEEKPKPPAGYRRVVRDSYEYWLHPAMKDAEIDALHKTLGGIESAFVAWHGPGTWTAETPFVVVVTSKNEDSAAIEQDASWSRHGAYAARETARLFVTPLAPGDAPAAAELAGQAWESFLDQGFSDEIPFWLYLGEGGVAAAASLVGKPLPAVPEGQWQSIPRPLPRLDELLVARRAESDVVNASFAYVAFFRCGPKPYRDAFAAFLAEIAATDECAAAQKKHLISLDQEKLRAAADSFVAKGLAVVKGK